MHTQCVFVILIVFCLWFFPLSLAAQEEERDPDALDIPETWQGQEETLEVLETVWAEESSIASRVAASVEQAPSIVMVITAQQIRDMGARSLQDVMKIVPSFDALSFDSSGSPIESYLGSLRVLVLHNGARLNDYYSGYSTGTEYQIFLENVDRLEIISGPGSALYGANAFGGVINIITKSPAQLNGIQIGGEHTSLSGQRYHVLGGKQVGEFSASLFAQYFEENGEKFFIQLDRNGQEGYIRDKLMQAVDIDLQAGYKGIDIEVRYLRRNPHMFFSNMVIQPTFDDRLRLETENISFRGDYQQAFFSEKGLLKLHSEYKRTLLEYRAAIAYPAQGYNKIPSDDIGAEVSFTYSFLEGRNTATAGIRLGRERLFDALQKANFDETTGDYFDEMLEVPSNNPDSERTIWSAYAEDVWKVSDRFLLTLGLRLDRYTQFGSTVNPRVALVYTPRSELALRLLYGRAFRAPTAIEAYDLNFGADELKPEVIRNYGASISYELFDNWMFQGYLSYGIVDDVILFVEDPATASGLAYRNAGNAEARGVGGEIKGMYRFGYVWLNYYYLEVGFEDENSENTKTGVPKNFASAGLNIEIGTYLNLNVWGYYRGERLLGEGENFVKTEGSTTLNLSLRVVEALPQLEGYLSLYNLLDTATEIPGAYGLSIPMRGREIIGGLRYTF